MPHLFPDFVNASPNSIFCCQIGQKVPVKGINLVCMSDGSVRKVFVLDRISFSYRCVGVNEERIHIIDDIQEPAPGGHGI